MIKRTFIINGVSRTVLVDENETLASFLRERLLLTGCKIGCGEGHCGACNVIVDGKVARSCIMKLALTGRTKHHLYEYAGIFDPGKPGL